MSNGWGIIPWGVGYWGIPHPSAPPTNAFVNIINVQPSPGSFNIAKDQTFTFTIKSKFAINTNSVYVFLDNKIVINGGFLNTAEFTILITTNIDGTSKDYSITPNYLFKDREVFSLQISARDIYGNPAPPFWGGYIVIDQRPPLITPIYPLDGYVDVPLDVSLHFLINQLAAPDGGLDVSTLDVYVDSTPAILNGVIQPSFNGIFSAINVPNNIIDPIEIILDSLGRYAENDIVIVKVSIKENGIIPIISNTGVITDQKGVVAAQGIVVNNINKLGGSQYDLILNSSLKTYTLSGMIITDGYIFKDDSDHTFEIGIVGVQEIIVNTIANKKSGSFSFITAKNYETLVDPIFSGYFQGVYFVDNLGDGYHINVTWHSARTTRPDFDLAYLIFYSTIRSDVFFEGPKIITQGRRLKQPETINGADPQLTGFYSQITLPVGVTHYFGVRATEYPHSNIPVVPPDGYGSFSAGLITTDGYSFAIPLAQDLLTSVSGIGNIVVEVKSTKGFANIGGFIIVGSEIMRYSSLTSTTFIIPLSGRGLFGTIAQSLHSTGEQVRMYCGSTDDNTIIEKNLVSWEPPNDPHRFRPDLITTDFSLEDANHAGFEAFDYCGYHRQRPDELFNDQQCNTYVGGEFNGHRGLFLYDRELANEEQLLEVTGEPVILLRRLWSGETCPCRTSRKDISRVRSCAICFGTGFKGGYIRYHNPRRIDQMVMVHFAPTDEEIAMKPQAGWDQTFTPTNWTLPIPAIKDRDLLIRFDEFGQRDWIYRVDSASRGKGMFSRYARQRLKISRIDKTDIEYTFKLI
jgi:hypothetical protein